MRKVLVLLVVLSLLLAAVPSFSQDMVELRIRWYNDGNEGEVLRDLFDRYEADNPGVSIEIDTVPYSAILENLPLDLAAGEGPDMARVTNLGGLAQYYLDMPAPTKNLPTPNWSSTCPAAGRLVNLASKSAMLLIGRPFPIPAVRVVAPACLVARLW